MVAYYQSLRIVVVTIFFPPGMFFHLLHSNPLVRVNCQHSSDKILEFQRNMTRNIVLAIQYLAIEFRCILILEGEETADHGKQDDSGTPDIDHQWFIGMFAFNHFWSSIARRSTGSSESFFRFVSIGQSEVNNSDGFVVIDKAILKFKISMYDSKFVYILDSTYDLFEDFAGLFLSHSFFTDYIVE